MGSSAAMLLRTRSQSVLLGWPEIVIDSALLSRGLAERDDTYIVSPNGLNESKDDAVRFNEGYIQPAFFPATSHLKGNLIWVFEYYVGIVKIQPMLPQV